MSGTTPAPSVAAPQSGQLVYVVIDLFVGWRKTHCPGRTPEWHQAHPENFLDGLPDRWTLAVKTLKPFHVVN